MRIKELIIAGSLFCATPAFADVTYNGYSLVNGSGVYVHYGSESIHATAGMVALNNVQYYTGGPISTLYVWCADIQHGLQVSGSYILENAEKYSKLSGQSITQLTTEGTKISDISALIYAYSTGIAGSVNNGSTADQVAAAIQTSIWVVEYATGITTKNGKITGWSGIDITPDDPKVTTDALKIMNSIGSLNIPDLTLEVLYSNNNQSMAFNIRNVPEPMSISILSVGIFALGVLRHKK